MVEFTELKKHQDILEICGKCGDCGTTGTQISTAKRHVSEPCPVKNVMGFEAYDARGRILIMKRLLENNFKIDENFLNWTYSCTECASCRETCLAIQGGIDTPLLMDALRQDLVNNKYSLQKHNNIINSVLENQNPYNEPKDSRLDFLEGETLNQESEVLLYIGCTPSYRQKNIATSTVKLLKELGIDFKLLKDEPCCGSVVKRFGYKSIFEDIAKENIKRLVEDATKTIIFPCAGCYRTYKLDYEPYNDTDIKFYHLTEFLEEYLRNSKFAFKSQSHLNISYHDPCHLGRHAGVYEAPRKLLRNIENSTFTELDTLRNYSHCCGAGGGVKSSNNDLATEIAKNRDMEAVVKSIELLISACPFCERNLKDGLCEETNSLEIMDISEILLQTFKKDLTSQLYGEADTNSEICKNYMKFLGKYPEIFSDLIPGSDMDFAIYDSFESFEEETPMDAFHVFRKEEGIEIKAGKADDADLELALSQEAIMKLIQTNSKNDYASLFGTFYNEPDMEEGWIDFLLHKRTKTLIDMGYGKFAEAAGILEDEDDVM